MRILTISGSLRSSSSNATLLRAAAALAPADATVVTYDGLADLPAFNPDRDDEGDASAPPPPVAAFRAALRAADAVMISSPEYAHGVPGVLKNALDWVVGSGELVDKPVALVNAAPHASLAQASLVETLLVMSARVVGGAPFAVPLTGPRRGLDAAAVAADPELAAALRRAVDALVAAVRAPTDATPSSPALSPAELFVARSRYFLAEEYRVKIRRAVEAMPEGALWARANDASNSAGNLLLHLAGNVRQWIVAGVGGVETTARDRAGEFAARDTTLGAAALLAALDATLDEADAVIASLGPGDLAARRTIQGRELTVLEAVYHVVEHFALHLGQIVLLAKAYAPGAVRFYEDAGGLARPIWK